MWWLLSDPGEGVPVPKESLEEDGFMEPTASGFNVSFPVIFDECSWFNQSLSSYPNKTWTWYSLKFDKQFMKPRKVCLHQGIE